MAFIVTPAHRCDRAQVAALAEELQQASGNTVELAYVNRGYTGPAVAEAAGRHCIRLKVTQALHGQARHLKPD